MSTESNDVSFHWMEFRILKHDLDELLESIKHPQHDLDIYQQRTILRDGIELISKRCGKVIELAQEEN